MEGRRQEIVELVNRQGEVTFAELKEHFPNVSEVTLRKDLRMLDAEQHIIRVFGGAKSISSAFANVDDFYTRFTKHTEEKKLIAQKAIRLLKPYDSLYLAAGSTCSAIAKELPDIPLRVFTDGLEPAISLAKMKKVEVTVLGGEMERETMRMAGPKVMEELQQLRLDWAFSGTIGYNKGYGFGCHSSYYAMLTRLLRRRADKLVIVMDSSKVNVGRTVRNLEERDVDILISDGKLDKELVAYLADQDVTVL